MKTVPELFGWHIFDGKAMKERLSRKVYRSLKRTIDEGVELDNSIIDDVAQAMKDWAVSNGATHYTHWSQPMNGLTAEKHESFISPTSENSAIFRFSGKDLIRGEADGSSFPSGGLRDTAKGRGYTIWDPTSYAFIKDKTLYIPAVLCSYTGEALDYKTPLLRSLEALNKQALRILRIFGDKTTKSVYSMVGPEQEYFLIDKNLYEKRPDLINAGRTLFGAKPEKGQELDDHYYGDIKSRVAAFMNELNEELWKLGIFAKTEHNEVAPAQHELATVYTRANLAVDRNLITMELMKKIAARHDMVCLLNEKPFAGMNGSGKHNNWSLVTDAGINLLSPGDAPQDNLQFMIYLCAVIKAVDDYQDLLRLSVAHASNDHRLGAQEAPPAVVSIFLGDELEAIVDSICRKEKFVKSCETPMDLGVAAIPKISKDNTDRNRTSPFAFTGNKFEFRMLGSSVNIGFANIMLNSAVAASLKVFADRLEAADSEIIFEETVRELIRDSLTTHRRIIFNGDGYKERWIEEAKRRALLNLRTTPECIPYLLDKRNVDMLTSMGIFTESELKSRYIVEFEKYINTVSIEARTMMKMAAGAIIPAVCRYTSELSDSVLAKKAVDPSLQCLFETELVEKLSKLTDDMASCVSALGQRLEAIHGIEDVKTEAFAVKDTVIPAMSSLRAACDKAEKLTAKEHWPMPDYSDLLYSVKM